MRKKEGFQRILLHTEDLIQLLRIWLNLIRFALQNNNIQRDIEEFWSIVPDISTPLRQTSYSPLQYIIYELKNSV